MDFPIFLPTLVNLQRHPQGHLVDPSLKAIRLASWRRCLLSWKTRYFEVLGGCSIFLNSYVFICRKFFFIFRNKKTEEEEEKELLTVAAVSFDNKTYPLWPEYIEVSLGGTISRSPIRSRLISVFFGQQIFISRMPIISSFLLYMKACSLHLYIYLDSFPSYKWGKRLAVPRRVPKDCPFISLAK